MGLEGVFIISCLAGNFNLCVPSDMNEDFPGRPLQCMPPGLPPAIVRIQNCGGDKYELVSTRFPDHVIASLNGSVPKLLHLVTKQHPGLCTQWAIDPAGSDIYNIRAASGSGDECWTLNGGPGGETELKPADGGDTQKWRLIPVQED
ncbi:unnamed protein product [Rhizoctonia solani]|uniref:Uncharacterized protein n=1 Tax=Rhizoctonia solani TaxID=456999 RepID=A0A8H3GH13_9AGAM|nr:unnamed protein product [Rhizoctonia solani]